jgi:hypothetical protein
MLVFARESCSKDTAPVDVLLLNEVVVAALILVFVLLLALVLELVIVLVLLLVLGYELVLPESLLSRGTGEGPGRSS